MRVAPQTNYAAIKIIKKWEGFAPKAFLDKIANPPVWTIGYGHTSRAGAPIVEPGMEISEAEATKILVSDMQKWEAIVWRSLRPEDKIRITQNQYAAYVSLCHNIGPTQFRRSTTLKAFKRGDLELAADALTWFNKAGGVVVDGLVNRRADEKRLFQRPSDLVLMPGSGGVEIVKG